MFQKKVTKKSHKDVVQQPEINYMNIYTSNVKRLSCFENVTSKAEEVDYMDETYQEGGYFYGDATAYEQQLDKVLKQLSSGNIPQNSGIIMQPNNEYMGGYQTTFNLNSTAFVPTANVEPFAPTKLFQDLPQFKINLP